jgi:hypothetical protein
VALLHRLVGALQDRVLLQGLDRLLLLDAAEPGLGIVLAGRKVDPSGYLEIALAGLPCVGPGFVRRELLASGQRDGGGEDD